MGFFSYPSPTVYYSASAHSPRHSFSIRPFPTTMSSATSDPRSSLSPTPSIEPPTVNLNYDEIIDLLVNNKPVPGIVEIPDTVLGPEMTSMATAPQRRKPWETAIE